MRRTSISSLQSTTVKFRKGLSLSIQKNQNRSSIKQNNTRNQQNQQQAVCSSMSSNKKNRIKFVQGYNNNQSSGNKFNQSKKKFFKIVDQDLQLGGKKRGIVKSGNQQNNNPLFLNKNDFTINKQRLNPHYQSDRKVLRQSKVSTNIYQNIQYFQSLNPLSCLLKPSLNPQSEYQSNFQTLSNLRLNHESGFLHSQQLFRQPFKQINQNSSREAFQVFRDNVKGNSYKQIKQNLLMSGNSKKCLNYLYSNGGLLSQNSYSYSSINNKKELFCQNYISQQQTLNKTNNITHAQKQNLKNSTLQKLQKVQNQLDSILNQAYQARQIMTKC